MSYKLLPCPLCGNKADVTKLLPKLFNISCGIDETDHCGLVLFGSSGVTKKDMVKQWNTRTEPTKGD